MCYYTYFLSSLCLLLAANSYYKSPYWSILLFDLSALSHTGLFNSSSGILEFFLIASRV